LPDQAFLIGLSSIYWRESWKYGERAYRYCNHDVGHALGAFAFAAACLGWKVQVVDSLSDAEISIILGVDKQSGIEAEHVDCLIIVCPNTQHYSTVKAPLTIDPVVMQALQGCKLLGDPNRLSNNHHEWPIIEKVALSTEKACDNAGTAEKLENIPMRPGSLPQCNETAFQVIQQRRSALAMDGVTDMARSVFFGILGRLQVERNAMMFECLPWAANVSLFLFVHRVRDLPPGLYVLVRDPSHEPLLRQSANPDFLWERSDPQGYLRFYLLAPQEVKREAKVICCHQDIAADGVFSLGMLARFDDVIAKKGPWYYPRLFWETGLIGQVLYLEAEAAGMRSTGIGCFFDDAMHQVLGITDHAWQSLYHFTVGAPLEDQRLQSYPCYHHLDSSVM
jgi:nitroreductase